MDPITAFSLFCNIVTTVDAAVKTAKTLKELYSSSSGFYKEAKRLRDETDKLTAIANDLLSSQTQISSIPQHPLLQKVAAECLNVYQRIQLILDKCKVEPHGPRAIAVVKSWARSQKLKSELRSLQSELELSSDRLQTAMALATR